MSTSNFSSAPDNTSDATYRAWITAVHTAFAAILTYVAQTGDVNLATQVKPASTNTKAGFKVYRFNDSAHATHPMYLKVFFGSGSNQLHPAIWLNVGQAVDGSGVLSAVVGGTLMTEQQLVLGTSSASNYDSYVSGDGSRLSVSLWGLIMNTSTRPLAFNIERSRDSLGVITDEAVHLASCSPSPNVFQQTITKIGLAYNNLDRNEGNNDCFLWAFPVKTTTSSLAYGLRVGLGALCFADQTKLYNSPTGMLIYCSADILGVDPITVSGVYGGTAVYVPTGRGGSGLISNDSLKRVAIRND